MISIVLIINSGDAIDGFFMFCFFVVHVFE